MKKADSAEGGKEAHRGARTADGRGSCARTNPPAVQPEGKRRGEAGSIAGGGRRGSESVIRPGAQAPPFELMEPRSSTGGLAVLAY